MIMEGDGVVANLSGSGGESMKSSPVLLTPNSVATCSTNGDVSDGCQSSQMPSACCDVESVASKDIVSSCAVLGKRKNANVDADAITPKKLRVLDGTKELRTNGTTSASLAGTVKPSS